MTSRTTSPTLGVLGALLLSLVLDPAALSAAAPAKPAQRTFPSAKAAADAFVDAAEKFDVEALKAILGPDGIDLVVTEDAVQDKNEATAFAAKAREKLAVVPDPKNPKSATLVTGAGEWPMPIPVVKKGSSWRFDTVAGRKEVLLRRIGRNELDAIQICRGFVEAQHEYAGKKREGARVNQYAQRIISTPGKIGRPGMWSAHHQSSARISLNPTIFCEPGSRSSTPSRSAKRPPCWRTPG